jgi:hypothetical protein
MTTQICSLSQSKTIAEMLIGEDVTLMLSGTDGEPRRLPKARWRAHDDGYCTSNIGVVSSDAIIGVLDSEEDGIILELDKSYIEASK